MSVLRKVNYTETYHQLGFSGDPTAYFVIDIAARKAWEWFDKNRHRMKIRVLGITLYDASKLVENLLIELFGER